MRWIDLESCCTGPVEWDAAFLPAASLASFPGVDRELLALLRRLNSARVATGCWARADVPEMRRHGEHHLALLHEADGSRSAQGRSVACGRFIRARGGKEGAMNDDLLRPAQVAFRPR